MLKQRIVTAVILFAAIVVALCISPKLFLLLAAIAFGAAFWEWLRICGWNSAFSGVIGAVIAAGLYYLTCWVPGELNLIVNDQFMTILTSAGVVLWAVLSAVVFFKRSAGWKISLVLGSVLPFILLPIAWFSLVWLYTNPAGGTLLMLSVLAIVWVADIGAYFIGMSVGGPKMAVGISPKKTWSGAIGGALLVVVLGYLFYFIAPQWNLWTTAVIKNTNIYAAGLIFLITVVFSIAGDLFESVLKRTAGVKDSSNLLPGHGGVYDRIDAQLPVLPLSVFILLFFQGY